MHSISISLLHCAVGVDLCDLFGAGTNSVYKVTVVALGLLK